MVDKIGSNLESAETIACRVLQSAAAGAGVALTDQALAGLARYTALLLEWNERMNLTAITKPEEVAVKHFLDSMMLAELPECAGDLVDVGSGAGFPGMVVKICRPEMAVTLLEPNGKRQTFLQNLAAQLGLRVEFLKERAEEAAKKGYRERYQVATARAVAPLPMLCEYCLPLVRPGGWFIAMKGEAAQEVADARAAIEKLGGRLARVQPYTLPGAESRCFIVIEKVTATPPAYPRAGGVIKKRPL